MYPKLGVKMEYIVIIIIIIISSFHFIHFSILGEMHFSVRKLNAATAIFIKSATEDIHDFQHQLLYFKELNLGLQPVAEMGLRYTNGAQAYKWGSGIQMGLRYTNGAQAYKWGSGIQMGLRYTNGAQVYKWGSGIQMGLRYTNGAQAYK